MTRLTSNIIQMNGGPGSGDWGHAGRPGMRGGSAGKGKGGSGNSGSEFNKERAHELQTKIDKDVKRLDPSYQRKHYVSIGEAESLAKSVKEKTAELEKIYKREEVRNKSLKNGEYLAGNGSSYSIHDGQADTRNYKNVNVSSLDSAEVLTSIPQAMSWSKKDGSLKSIAQTVLSVSKESDNNFTMTTSKLTYKPGYGDLNTYHMFKSINNGETWNEVE